MTEKIAALFGVPVPQLVDYTPEIECSNPDLVLGMEIETENCRWRADKYMEQVRPLGWQVTTDGSLRGTAYEFISMPMKMKHLAHNLEEFYKRTGFTEENYTDRCSIHVHVNCTDLTIPQLAAFALVYAVFEESIFDFVGQYRDTNIYCIPWNQCRFNQKLITRLYEHLYQVPKQWQKYTAVNLIPLQVQGTVEFRHMHGSADLVKIRKWLNIIGCLFKYSTSTDLKEVVEVVKNINTVSNYEQFFNLVFQGWYEYSEEIHRKLEAGVISAKLALINYDPTKEAPKVPKKEKVAGREPTFIVDDMLVEAAAVRPRRMPIDPTPGNVPRTAAQINAHMNLLNQPPVAPEPHRQHRGQPIAPRAGMRNTDYLNAFGFNMFDELVIRERGLANLGLAHLGPNSVEGVRI